MEKIICQNSGIPEETEEVVITQEELTIEPIMLEPVVIDFSLNKDE